MDIVGQATNSVGNFNKEFQNYSNNNTLIIVAAAVCVGIATKEIIEKLMNETVLPILQFMIKTSIYYWIYNFLLKSSVSKPVIVGILQTVGTVSWLFLLWSVIVFLSFVLFKKLLDKNLISSQLGFWQNVGGYAITLEENISDQIKKM
jgi:large-conductance mechanosensitive channel